MQVSNEVREEARARRKRFNEDKREALETVEAAIDSLNAQSRSFGGHLERDRSSTIDGLERDRVQHRDGRVMRFVRFLDGEETPYLTALVTYRGRWLVVPAYKLRAIG